jgi:hypothetical protein
VKDSFVLVDTSAWLLALRKKYLPSIRERIDALLGENRVATAGIIKLELLGGTKTESEFYRLKSRLDALFMIETDDSVWERASRLAFELRRQGITVPYTDILIASSALKLEATILHVDYHFDVMAKHAEIKVESFVS